MNRDYLIIVKVVMLDKRVFYISDPVWDHEWLDLDQDNLLYNIVEKINSNIDFFTKDFYLDSTKNFVHYRTEGYNVDDIHTYSIHTEVPRDENVTFYNNPNVPSNFKLPEPKVEEEVVPESKETRDEFIMKDIEALRELFDAYEDRAKYMNEVSEAAGKFFDAYKSIKVKVGKVGETDPDKLTSVDSSVMKLDNVTFNDIDLDRNEVVWLEEKEVYEARERLTDALSELFANLPKEDDTSTCPHGTPMSNPCDAEKQIDGGPNSIQDLLAYLSSRAHHPAGRSLYNPFGQDLYNHVLFIIPTKYNKN